MNCDLFMQNIDAFFDGELSETEMLTFEEHKNNCTECNLLFESYKEMLSSLNDMNEMDIPFPEGLHDNIMRSVNEVAEQRAKSESNVSNVIDITSYINENEKNVESSKPKFFDTYKKNTLVAGLLSVFVATGAYKTYDTYTNNSLLDQDMLAIDIADDNSVADSNAQNTQAVNDTQEKDPSTTQETKDNTTNGNTTQVGDSTNLATTTQEPAKANEVNETTSTNTPSDKVENSSLSTEVSTFSVPETDPNSNVLKSTPKTKVSPMSTDADISIKLDNTIDFEHFMTYLRNAPSLNIQLEDATQPKASIITVDSDDIASLVDYIDNYPNGDVVVEYLDESLKNLNTLTNFKLKVVTEE